jgi:hypothetical protein
MNNMFLAGGVNASRADDTSGYYAIQGASLWRDVVGVMITGEGATGGTMTTSILNDLVANGYVNINGYLQDKARQLTDISQFVYNSPYTTYKNALYDALKKTLELDNKIRSTVAADYNYVAGAAPNFYPKRGDNCTVGIFTPYRFREPHGVNGGNPMLANINDPDGPDNIPFTLDDGVKPMPGSPLCGKGYGGTDIGALSCSPSAVFAVSSGSLIPPSGSGATTPPPPTSCATTNTCKPGDFNKDGTVNTNDYSYLNSSWNTSDPTTDLNKDGRVNTLDYAIMIQNWMK